MIGDTATQSYRGSQSPVMHSGFLGKGTGALKGGLPKVTELVRGRTPVIPAHGCRMSSGTPRYCPQPKKLELKCLLPNLTAPHHAKHTMTNNTVSENTLNSCHSCSGGGQQRTWSPALPSHYRSAGHLPSPYLHFPTSEAGNSACPALLIRLL